MKALTLTQPWASLVAVGAKRIETRSWATSYRGPLAIHAAKGWSASDREFAGKLIREKIIRVPLAMTWPSPVNRHDEVLPLGRVIAMARLVNCIPTEPSASLDQTIDQWGGHHEISFGDYSPGRWAWLLADIVPLEEPIPARGALGLWDWTPTPMEVHA